MKYLYESAVAQNLLSNPKIKLSRLVRKSNLNGKYGCGSARSADRLFDELEYESTVGLLPLTLELETNLETNLFFFISLRKVSFNRPIS